MTFLADLPYKLVAVGTRCLRKTGKLSLLLSRGFQGGNEILLARNQDPQWAEKAKNGVK